jgi:tetratricopeptide (TPR) repeat protein
MTIDSYAICPCGSGKKIKFCAKCKDTVGTLDEIAQMIEGGQIVPALDRLGSVLQQHPDAAWALAVRGRLLLDLREYDSLTENAERFIRLQPGNPLALTQRAAAHLYRGDVEPATELILEALTESGQTVDSFVLEVATVLAFSLAQQGVHLTARVYATLAMMAGDATPDQTVVQVFKQLNSSPHINQLFKSIPRRIARPANVEWAERYDEAATLLQSNKITLAESKFQSLQRTVSGQPAILSGLLSCAIWRGDVAAQADLLKKLSDCESIDFEQRVRFRALAALVNPKSQETSINIVVLTATLETLDEVQMALLSSPRIASLPAETLVDVKASEDDVPPRAGFQLLDRDKPESLDKLPPVDQVPEAVAMILLYGKQTDRDARLELVDVRADQVDDVLAQITAIVGPLPFEQTKSFPMPILMAAQPPIAMLQFHAKPAEAEALQNELVEARMADVTANLRLPLLDGQSLIQVADDSSKLLQRTAVVRIVELYDALASRSEHAINRLYELAKLEKLPALKPTPTELESIANEDLHRIDPDGLPAESLVYLLQRAQQVAATLATRRLAKRLIEIELPAAQQKAKLLAYMSLINATTQTTEALALMDQAKAFAEANSIPMANLLLSEVGLRLSAGDGEGFQRAIETLTSRYRSDPQVMAQLQQLLVAYGLINPDGSPRQIPRSAAAQPETAAEAGKLWTPGSGAAAPASSADGGSKLWVPGMD